MAEHKQKNLRITITCCIIQTFTAILKQNFNSDNAVQLTDTDYTEFIKT